MWTSKYLKMFLDVCELSKLLGQLEGGQEGIVAGE